MNNTLPSDEQTYTRVDGTWSTEDGTHQELDAEKYNILTSCYPDLTTSTLGVVTGSWTPSSITTTYEPPVTCYTKDEVDTLLSGITLELQKLKEELSELKSLPQNQTYFAEKDLIEKLLSDNTLL